MTALNYFQVERGQCDYLLIHAGDDQQLPPTLTERLCKRFRDHHKSNYRLLVYPGAGHLLEPPYSPHFYATYQALFCKYCPFCSDLLTE